MSKVGMYDIDVGGSATEVEAVGESDIFIGASGRNDMIRSS